MRKPVALFRFLITIWACIGLDPAWGLTAGQYLILFGAGFQFPGATADMNFATGQYYGLTPAALTTSRASTESEVCNGQLTTFAINKPAITPGCGLWVWEARTNWVANSTGVGAVVGVQGSGGSVPTGWSSQTPAGISTTIVATGTENGIPYVDLNYSGTIASSTSLFTLYFVQGVAVTPGQTFSTSAFLRLISGSVAGIPLVLQPYWYTAGSSFIGGGPSFNPAITAAPLGTQSFVEQATAPTTTASANATFVQYPPVAAGTYNFTIRFGAPQLELNPNLPATVASGAQSVTNSGTSTCVSGTYTVSGGTGTAATLTGVASGGVITSLTTLTGGSYSVFPPSPAALTGTGCSGSPTVTLTPTNNAASAFATGPILTSGSATTRAASNIALPVSIVTAFQSKGAMAVRSNAINGSGGHSYCWQPKHGQPDPVKRRACLLKLQQCGRDGQPFHAHVRRR